MTYVAWRNIGEATYEATGRTAKQQQNISDIASLADGHGFLCLLSLLLRTCLSSHALLFDLPRLGGCTHELPQTRACVRCAPPHLSAPLHAFLSHPLCWLSGSYGLDWTGAFAPSPPITINNAKQQQHIISLHHRAASCCCALWRLADARHILTVIG